MNQVPPHGPTYWSMAFALLGLVMVAGCPGSPEGTTGTGGSTGSGGAGTTGGRTGSGGFPGSGGMPGSGGNQLGTGGGVGTGGGASTGGMVGSGGNTATGGVVATGGAGGRGTGGAAGTGAGGRGGTAGTGVAGRAGTAGTGMAGRGGSVGTGTGGAGGTNCMTPPAPSPLTGWAAATGMGLTTTTGGGTATPQTVTTVAAFNAAAAGTGAAVIYVRGVLPAGRMSIGSNKTIVGVCGAEIHGHLGLSGSVNVIVRNLKIVGYGVGNCALDPGYDAAVGCSSGDDAVTVQNSAHHIWFDHCDVMDGTDGNLDITNGADFVTVSWTKFHYTPRTDPTGNDSTGASGHRFSNLIGGDDAVPGDAGHLNVTWHHDWWAENVNQRMPRTRAGKIHLFNNLFTSTGNSVCTNAGYMANLLVENSIYTGVRGPLQVDADGSMLARGNVFTGTSGGTTTATGPGFTPPYDYASTMEATTNLAATIMASVGPR